MTGAWLFNYKTVCIPLSLRGNKRHLGCLMQLGRKGAETRIRGGFNNRVLCTQNKADPISRGATPPLPWHGEARQERDCGLSARHCSPWTWGAPLPACPSGLPTSKEGKPVNSCSPFPGSWQVPPRGYSLGNTEMAKSITPGSVSRIPVLPQQSST